MNYRIEIHSAEGGRTVMPVYTGSIDGLVEFEKVKGLLRNHLEIYSYEGSPIDKPTDHLVSNQVKLIQLPDHPKSLKRGAVLSITTYGIDVDGIKKLLT